MIKLSFLLATLVGVLSSTPAFSDSPPPASTDKLREGTSNLYFTTTRARSAISANSPLGYSAGVLSLPASTSSTDGYLKSTDWTLFNNKEPSISSGLSTQYWRGDKTWQLLDTSAVPENGNLYFTSARFTSEFATKSTTDLTEGLNLYWTQARFNTAFSGKSTTDLAEGSNLYFTNARVDTEFDTRLATKSTSNLSEGTNLYYTQGRFDTAFSGKTTDSLTEGVGNQYFTTARAQSAAASGLPAQEFYVAKDTGNDANSCTLTAPCRTIQRGINVANAVGAYFKQAIVHVAPSSGGSGSGYAENITFSQQGVNVVCDGSYTNARSCFISGSVTVNMTGTAGGANFQASSNEASLVGFVVSASSTTNAITFSGTTYQKLYSINNFFDQNGTVAAAVVSNSGVTGSTPSALLSWDTNYSNSNATNPAVDVSAGRFWMYGTIGTVANGNASGPSFSQSGSSSVILNLAQVTGQYNLTSNTATATFNLTSIASGSNPCIVTPSSPSTGYASLNYFACNSTATNSITGSGIVVNAPGNVRLNTSGDIITTVTQTNFPGLPQGKTLIGNKATSATNVLLSVMDGHVKVSQTTAPTATVNANAGTSSTCTLTNGRDSSGIINLTEGSASWASGTQCVVTFNLAYSVAPNCVLWPHNAAAASHLVTQQVFSTTTTTTLVLAFGAADSAATASQWSYKCEEP
jgi:hypothetical protein